MMLPLTSRVRNILRAALQYYGTPGMKRALWNGEFSNGRWHCLNNTAGDCVYPFVETYARQGSILDLGCGSGNTATEVLPVYSDYLGIDISDVAIQQAIQRSHAGQRDILNHFVQSDIATFVPDSCYDVILFRDSIYYIPLRKTLATLNRYSCYLKDAGVFIVRLWGSDNNGQIVHLIENHFTVLEKHSHEDPKALILVFR